MSPPVLWKFSPAWWQLIAPSRHVQGNGLSAFDRKKERLLSTKRLLYPARCGRNAFGKTCQVLIERAGRHPGQMLGKSPWLQSVHLATDARIGDLVEVEITAGYANSLAGVEKVRAAA